MNKLEENNKDFTWLNNHTPELQERYAGKWIAVVNQEVVGIGDTAKEAFNQARKRYPSVRPLLDVVPTEELDIMKCFGWKSEKSKIFGYIKSSTYYRSFTKVATIAA